MIKGKTVRLHVRWDKCRSVMTCNNCVMVVFKGNFCWNCGNDIRETTKTTETED